MVCLHMVQEEMEAADVKGLRNLRKSEKPPMCGFHKIRDNFLSISVHILQCQAACFATRMNINVICTHTHTMVKIVLLSWLANCVCLPIHGHKMEHSR